MEAIEIARRLSALNQSKEACHAYAVALHTGGLAPEEELGAASYILQHGGDYISSAGSFCPLRSCRFNFTPLMTKVSSPSIRRRSDLGIM